MCGIIGVVGSAGALETVLEGLSRLEYRGYDSAGVAFQLNGDLWSKRSAEGTRSVDALKQHCEDAPAGLMVGIGHTRWATHGNPTEANAHPHLGCASRIGLIHNGIIENHVELKAKLEGLGHGFRSSTDTEVMVHLLEDELRLDGDLVAATRRMLTQLRGAFAVAIVSADHPDQLVAARRVSPLIVGMTGKVSYLGSDIPALMGKVNHVFAIEEDHVVDLRPGTITVTNEAGEVVQPEPVEITWTSEVAEKGGFDDFMTKEIHEQPEAIAATLASRIDENGSIQLDDVDLDEEDLRQIDKVVIVGCGSSFHAGLVGKFAIERWAGLPTEVDIASEFRYRDAKFGPSTLVVGVSQSGETIDTLEAIKQARKGGSKVIAISNIVGASMTREADGAIYTRAGLEVSVASTKTVLAQVIALELLALRLAELRGTRSAEEIEEILAELHTLKDSVQGLVADASPAEAVAHAIAGARDYFFLGRHLGYPVALEGALKLKEISYLRAEGYPAGELKHGPIALIEPGVVVVAVVLSGPMAEKMYSNIAEVKARGATVVCVAEASDQVVDSVADYVLRIPDVADFAAPVLAMVPLQQLAYAIAKAQGIDVDRPRNLAKTVTVE